ncbi:hypothetical protein HDU97_007029 [Phlyctochytrium planicorne]|nr:hypothetical protein HDU97_007029 [Phlyctochytrium planicorne]
MDALRDADGSFRSLATATLALGTAIIALLVWKLLSGGKAKKYSQYPRDTVILHIFRRPPPHRGIPSFSPYCLKLELYLRALKIPHVVVEGTTMSSKGKKPFITYNEEEVADSFFVILWLEEKFGKSLDSKVWPAVRPALEAYRTMTEDGLGKQFVLWRWNATNIQWLSDELFADAPWLLRKLLPRVFLKKVNQYLKGTGIDVNDFERNYEVADTRLAALSSLLGADNYMMSTDDPTSLDCTVYAFLVNILFQELGGAAGGQPSKLVLSYPNLVRYVRRISERYYPEFAKHIEWDGVEELAERCADKGYMREVEGAGTPEEREVEQ